MREEAGHRLASWSAIQRTPEGWKVPSETTDEAYTVSLNDEDGFTPEDWWARQPSCTCPDNRIRHVRCKHIYAVFHLLRDLTAEVGSPYSDVPQDYLVQGYQDFAEEIPPEGRPWADLLDRLFHGQHRLDERYDEFQQGADIPSATTEELWSELTFHRFLAGMLKVLRFTSEKSTTVDPRTQGLLRQRHQAVAYELQKRAAPVLEARFNDFFASHEEAELGWTIWNLAVHGLDRPIPPLIPPEPRRTGPVQQPSRQPAPGVEL